MKAIAKSAKIHPAAKKCCGWEKPAICSSYEHLSYILVHVSILVHMSEFHQPRQKFARNLKIAIL